MTVRSGSPARCVTLVLDRDHYQALAGFRYALRAFLAFSESATREAGVTAQQYQALLAIKASPNEGLLVGVLAAELLIKHHAAVQLADRLVAARLIRRATSPKDRRRVELRLTARGNKCVTYLAAIHYRELLERHSELHGILQRSKRLNKPAPTEELSAQRKATANSKRASDGSERSLTLAIARAGRDRL
ncbi:MAG: MarR family transcriptional regulator [Alphaproteobacteria bacterium]|nr:MarR family transcriptional regulator [Alphaproteobacteria bacterium]MBL7097809.1 MarR family transcriptional regulator [Alphaproteobacteria bacterium]